MLLSGAGLRYFDLGLNCLSSTKLYNSSTGWKFYQIIDVAAMLKRNLFLKVFKEALSLHAGQFYPYDCPFRYFYAFLC